MIWWRDNLPGKAVVSHLVLVPSSCVVFQLWSEQRGLSAWASRGTGNGFAQVFLTTAWTPTVSLAVRWEDQQTRVFLRERYSTERNIIIICTLCSPQLLLLVPPACWNTLRLKTQLNVRQRKSCNYLFTGFLFQIFSSKVISRYARALFLG